MQYQVLRCVLGGCPNRGREMARKLVLLEMCVPSCLELYVQGNLVARRPNWRAPLVAARAQPGARTGQKGPGAAQHSILRRAQHRWRWPARSCRTKFAASRTRQARVMPCLSLFTPASPGAPGGITLPQPHRTGVSSPSGQHHQQPPPQQPLLARHGRMRYTPRTARGCSLPGCPCGRAGRLSLAGPSRPRRCRRHRRMASGTTAPARHWPDDDHHHAQPSSSNLPPSAWAGVWEGASPRPPPQGPLRKAPRTGGGPTDGGMGWGMPQGRSVWVPPAPSWAAICQ